MVKQTLVAWEALLLVSLTGILQMGLESKVAEHLLD